VSLSKTTVSAVLTALVVCSSAIARDYYVSPAGDDTGPGTKQEPFETIQRAASVMEAGDTCFIHAGTYRETVRPAASGSEDAPLAFVGLPGERVMVSGADPVGGWKHEGKGTYVARLPEADPSPAQVYFGEQPGDLARWPNNADGNVMTPDGVMMDSGSERHFTCAGLKAFTSAKDLQGAGIWMLAGMKWSATTSRVEAFEPDTGTIRMKDTGRYSGFWGPGVALGKFYLYGTKALLDAPGEWYFDKSTRTLHVKPTAGGAPAKGTVSIKRRRWAFDLAGRSHIRIRGIECFAAAINFEGARHCLADGLRLRCFGVGREGGMQLGGTFNTVRNCKMQLSEHVAVHFSGRRNSLINCHIRDINYAGSMSTMIAGSGDEHLISHNTLHDTGRSVFGLYGRRNLVQYNNMYRAGLIAFDLGLNYQVYLDGGGSEFRYNWMHDCKGEGSGHGFYLDNFHANFLFHHNVVWGVDGDAVRLNKPSQYVYIFHNTLLGRIGNWGRWDVDDMTGVTIANNIVTEGIQPHPDLVTFTNSTDAALVDAQQLDFRLRPNASAIDAGTTIPGITDGFAGAAPDLGAYESSRPAWTAGHNFDNPPSPTFALTTTPYRNAVWNGSFEHERHSHYLARDKRDGMAPPGWTRIGGKHAVVVRSDGHISTHPDRRVSRIGYHGCALSGQDADGIQQVVTDLKPDTDYMIIAWAKVVDADALIVSVSDFGGQDKRASVATPHWSRAQIMFRTGNATSARITLMKQGAGTLYCDDIALIQAIPAYAPPPPPINLRVTSTGHARVALAWSPPDDTPKGIAVYRVYRDGEEIATTQKPSFVDDSLRGETTYAYGVAVVDRRWSISESATLSVTTKSDTFAPTVARIHSYKNTQVQLVFSEPVQAEPLTDKANYQIDPGVTIHSVDFDEDGRTVTLGVSELKRERTYRLAIRRVLDRARSPNEAKNLQATVVHHPERVGHWAFDKASCDLALDSTGNGNHGVIEGATRVKGVKGNALYFDGVDDRVTIPHHASLNVEGDMTVTLWIRLAEPSQGAYQRLLCKKSWWGDPDGFEVEISPANNKINVSGANTRQNDQGLLDLTLDSSWHRLDAVIKKKVVTLYLDKQRVSRDTFVSPPRANTVDLVLGAVPGGRNHFRGYIDELTIYRAAIVPEHDE
jgi:hypothetical protein